MHTDAESRDASFRVQNQRFVRLKIGSMPDVVPRSFIFLFFIPDISLYKPL